MSQQHTYGGYQTPAAAWAGAAYGHSPAAPQHSSGYAPHMLPAQGHHAVQQHYNAQYAAWYGAQQQQQLPPPQPQQPPLPPGEPPPLPQGEPPPPQQQQQQQPAQQPQQTPAQAPQQPANPSAYAAHYAAHAAYAAQQQHHHQQQHFGYAAHAAHYGSQAQQQHPHQQGAYAHPHAHAHTQHPYQHPQVARAPSPAPSAGGPSSIPQPQQQQQQLDYNRMPPPASLLAGAAIARSAVPPGDSGRAAAAAAAAGTTSVTPSAAPLSAPSSAITPGRTSSALDAMRAAATAAASRIAAGGPAVTPLSAAQSSAPMYVTVGTPASAGPAAVPPRPPASSAAAAGVTELPASLQQYVARALSLLGRSNEARLELRTLLRDSIARRRQDGTLWSTDWDREPLPVLTSAAAGGLSASRLHAGAAAGSAERTPGFGGRGRGRGGAGSSSMPWLGSTTTPRKRGRFAFGDDDEYDSDGGGAGGRGSSSNDDGDGSDEHGAGGLGRWGGGRRSRLDVTGSAGAGRGRGRKGKRGKRGGGTPGGDSRLFTQEDQARHAARGARFAGNGGSLGTGSTRAAYGWDEDDDEAVGEFIIGTSTNLEKRYLRLTRAPLPSEVRPQPVLEAALSRLLDMVVRHEDKYLYYNDQFKAMRQDLTVQGLRNAFAVQVYEAHARAALEYGDGAEYNQCQTQLAILYAAGLPGCHAEFGGYRLLYQAVHAAAGEGRRLLGTMRQMLAGKVGAGAGAGAPEVTHALAVRGALACSNVAAFFRLYTRAPRLGRRLMDVAVPPLRWRALNTLVRAHRPGPVPLSFLATCLGFCPAAAGDAAGAAGVTVDADGALLPGCAERMCTGEHAPAIDEAAGLAACLAWAKSHGALFDQEADLTAASLLTKHCWSSLFVPEDTSKVAHGDANLDIRDFLAL